MKTLRLVTLSSIIIAGCLEIPSGAPCTTDAQCPSRQVCVAQKCVPTNGGMGGGSQAAGGSAGGMQTGGGSAGGEASGGGEAGGEAGGTAGGDAGGTAGGDAGGTAGGDAGGMAGGIGGSGGGTAGGMGLSDGGQPDAGFAGLEVSTTTVNFGSITTGSSSMPTVVTVTNPGTLATGPLSVMVGGPNPSQFTIGNSTCTGALGAMSTCRFSVTFAPNMPGAMSATVVVSASPGGAANIALSGTSATPASLAISPPTQGFGSVGIGGNSAPQTFTVVNSGGSPSGTPTFTFTGTDGAMFSSTTTCTASLPPAMRCSVTVTFSPTSAGMKSATLEVRATGSLATAALSGQGLTPASISAAPAQQIFANTVTGQSSAALTVTVTNSGQVPTPPLVLMLGGSDPGDFLRDQASDTCSGRMVDPGTCTVSYRFAPSTVGLRGATLTLSAGSLTPATVRFEGTGLSGANLRFTATSLDLGTATVGTPTTAVIGLSNSGDVPSGTLLLGATPNAEFSVPSTTCGTTLAARTSCSVTVQFVPGAVGNRVGEVTVSGMPGGMATATLTGAGVTAGALTLNPLSRDFGSVVVGATGPFQDFTVVNTGGTTIAAVTLSVTGANPTSYTLTNNSCGGALNPASSCGGRITFSPQAQGALGAFLRASGGTSTAQASLSGTGLLQAALRAQTASITFPTTVVGQASAPISFIIENAGGVPSGPLNLSLGGTDVAHFALSPGTCTGTFGAGATCSGTVTYQPTSAAGSGSHSVTLTASATPGGQATIPISGRAITSANLTLAPAAGSATEYGNVLLGQTATQSFTVTNTGQQASGALSLSMSGTNGAQWQVASGSASCQIGQPLAGGASCTSAVRFTAFNANGNGGKNGTLTASATPGGGPALSLHATVQNPAALSSTVTAQDFAGVEVNASSPAFSWVISNTGDVPTGTLSIGNTNTVDYATSTTCPTTLAPGGMCTVSVTFRPLSGGVRTGTISVSGTPGGTINLGVTGRGQWRLTIVASFSGGTVATTDGRLNCGSASCSALYDQGNAVTVRASNIAGSGLHFGMWMAPSPTCTDYGQGRDCTVTMTAPAFANARFIPTLENLVFVTSTTFPATLGSATAYDTKCNEVATAAGLNNAANNGFIAWVSTDTSTVATRLGTTRGAYRRIDNTLFALSSNALLTQQRSMSLPNLDEYGKETNALFWSGTYGNGAANAPNDCTNWTSTTGNAEYGITYGGPARWANAYAGLSCGANARILCFGITSTTVASNPSVPGTGKVAYLASATINPSTMGAGLNSLDAVCAANKPPAFSTRTFVAWAGSGAQPASARITVPTANYYRVDGMLIGTGASLQAGNMGNGIWVYDNGTYAIGNVTVWTGSSGTSATPTAATCCSNWTINGTTGTYGYSAGPFVVSNDFFNVATAACTVSRTIYCIEP